MVAGSQVGLTGSAVECAVTHGTLAGEFVDLLVSDDEWVDREFDALVEAGWGGDAPARPAPLQGPRGPRRPRRSCRSTPAHHLGEPRRGSSGRAQQRGPPRHFSRETVPSAP